MRPAMPMIKIKRAYEKSEKSDGFRVLVDRLWPRGIKKEDLQRDLRAKEITPSTELGKWYHEDLQGRWDELCEKYRKELEQSDAVKIFLEKIKSLKTATLLYASKDETQNHAVVLKEFLETALIRKEQH